MKKRLSVVIVCSLMLLTASAQQQPSSTGPQQASLGRLGMGIDPVPILPTALIQKQAVQKALGLTEDQKKRIEALTKKLVESQKRQSDETRKQLSELGPDADREARAEISRPAAEASRKLRTETEAAILKVLDPKMRTRLREIQYQAEGPLALARLEVLDKLLLDEPQIEMVREIFAQGREQMTSDSLVTTRSTDTQGRSQTPTEKETKAQIKKNTEATTRSRDATTKAILKVLTKGQRARYEKLLGDPFDLATLRVDGPVQDAEAKKSDGSSPKP